MSARLSWAASRWLWVLLALYAVLAAVDNFIFPPFEPTDEPAHYGYVRWLIDERRFPVASAESGSEFHQPPLYYAVAALFAWPVHVAPDEIAEYFRDHTNPYRGFQYWEPGLDNKNLFLHGPWDAWPFRGLALSVHLARLASLACGLVTVYFSFLTARLYFDEGPALAAAGLVAFNPMFLAVSGSLQNDAGAAALGALAVWLGAASLKAGFTTRRAAALGLALGLGALAKITAVFLIPAAVVAVLAWAYQRRPPLPRGALTLGALLATAAASGGWWYWRNQVLYGEPSAVNVNLQAYGGRSLAQGLAVWRQALPYAWTTFWGRFGHGDVVLAGWIYAAIGLLVILAVPGLIWRSLRPSTLPRPALAFLAAAGLGELAGLLAYLTLSPSGYMGRYTFPALPAYALLLVAGWLGLVPARARRAFSLAVPAGFGALSVYVLAAYLVPVYTPPPALARLPASARPLDLVLGDVGILRGYEISPSAVQPGERVFLTLYWQPLGPTALPYSVYVHLFDQDRILVAQRDTYPGLGRYPTTAWQAGRLFADRYQVEIPAGAFAPARLTAEGGLWQTQTGDRAYVLDEAGQPVAADVSLGEVTLAARPGSTPNAMDLNFGGAWHLNGYTLSSRSMSPGQSVDLTTYWTSSQVPPADAFLFVHVAGDDGRLWVNQSMRLEPGTASLKLALAPDTPAGLYHLLVGVYREAGAEQARLKLIGTDGHELEDEVRLTGLRVAP